MLNHLNDTILEMFNYCIKHRSVGFRAWYRYRRTAVCELCEQTKFEDILTNLTQ